MLTFDRLLDILEIHKGDLLYIHSSFSRMKRFNLTACEIIRAITDRVGAEGTVVFPSFCWNIEPAARPWKGYEVFAASDIVFDVNNTKSNIGYLSEVFRHQDKVRRSAHPFWPICASGPLADCLVKDQHAVECPYGPQSSFGILKENQTKIVGMGVTLNTTSLCPIVDFDLEPNHTQDVFTDYKVAARVIDADGIEHQCATYAMRPDAVKNIKPCKVFELSDDLRAKTNFVEHEHSYFFSYSFSDYYTSAMPLGAHAIDRKAKMPWLELSPLRASNIVET